MPREPTKLETLREKAKNARSSRNKLARDAEPAFLDRAQKIHDSAQRAATIALADAHYDHAEATRRLPILDEAVRLADQELFEHEHRAKIEQLVRLSSQAKDLGLSLKDIVD